MIDDPLRRRGIKINKRACATINRLTIGKGACWNGDGRSTTWYEAPARAEYRGLFWWSGGWPGRADCPEPTVTATVPLSPIGGHLLVILLLCVQRGAHNVVLLAISHLGAIRLERIVCDLLPVYYDASSSPHLSLSISRNGCCQRSVPRVVSWVRPAVWMLPYLPRLDRGSILSVRQADSDNTY
jgi:hypothetical protein